MNVKKLCRRENNTDTEEGCSGIHPCRIQCLPLSSLSGSAPGDVRGCPSLALVSLRLPAIHSLWLSPAGLAGPPLFCSASFPSAHGPGMVHLMARGDCQYLFHLPLEGASGEIGRVGTLGHPPGAALTVFGEDSGNVSLSPSYMTWSVPGSFQ